MHKARKEAEARARAWMALQQKLAQQKATGAASDAAGNGSSTTGGGGLGLDAEIGAMKREGL